jgi:NDP-sugar pyrophosphorylase family protein
MGDLCDDTPKPMLLIQGKPKLAYTIEQLPDEIDEVILMVGYLKEKIIGYFGETYKGRKIRYIVHKKIDGTGKILHDAKDVLKEKFLVLMGDDLYVKEDLEKLLEYDMSILAFEVEDTTRIAVLESDVDGRLERIVEAPHNSNSYLANTGAYVLRREYFDYPLVLKAQGSAEYGLPQTMVQMKDRYAIHVVRAKDWFQVGDPEALELAQIRIRDFAE